MEHKEIDHITGTETTGHAWDGDLKELNTPLPGWWVWIFWITIVWGIAYSFVYPHWVIGTKVLPTVFDWSSRGDVHKALDAAKTTMAPQFAKLEKASLADLRSDAALSKFADKAGEAVYGDNCVACHGTGANGVFSGSGYPNLTDNDWLYGGKLEDIVETVRVGIRSGHEDERTNTMAAYGDDKTLNADQIKNVAGYVLSFSGNSLAGADIAKGKQIYLEEAACNACHGDDGKGVSEIPGAPNLADKIWLFGGSAEKIITSITHGRKGVMPAWDARLTPAQIKAVAVYVHSRGGGK
ncbi:MAG: cytochrome-c oxidase, cbb3-type subunit III [bacterium]|nr:cytochrome-c oxidase, cbb3-type subunit III [bacterium]